MGRWTQAQLKKEGTQAWLVGYSPVSCLAWNLLAAFLQDMVGLLEETLIGNAKWVPGECRVWYPYI